MQDSVTQSKSCLDAVLKILYLDQKIFVISHLLDLHSQIHLAEPSPRNLLPQKMWFTCEAIS